MNANSIEAFACLVGILAIILSGFGVARFVYLVIKRKEIKGTAVLLSIVLGIVISGYIALTIFNHYGVDSFAIYWDMAPFHSLTEGRYLKTAVAIFCIRNGFNQITDQRLFFAVWIGLTSLAVLLISWSLCEFIGLKDILKRISVTLGVLLFIVNPFCMELMLFPEVALENAITNLMLGVAVSICLSDIKNIPRYILSFVLIFITVSGYQCYMPAFVILVLAGVTIRYLKDKKRRYFEAVCILMIAGMSWVVDILIMKLFEISGAVDKCDSIGDIGLSGILNNIKQVIKVQADIWNDGMDTFYYRGSMTAIFIVLLVVAILIFRLLRDWEERLFVLLVFVVSYSLSFAVHVVEQPQEITPRSLMPVWAVIAAVFIMAVGFESEARSFIIKLVLGSVLTILVFNVWQINDIAANQRENNTLDFSEAKSIVREIKAYEKETGIVINETVMRSDGEVTYYHPDSRYKIYQLGGRIMATYFSRYHMLGYFLGHDLKDTYMSDEDFERLGKGKNWNSFNEDEQVFIEGDKVYIIVY